jgi:flagellar biosynthesis protein FlhG
MTGGEAVPRASARVTAITSGKGGVGKTVLAANLAAALAAQGERVLLLDADLGLANLDVVLGLAPARTLHDVVSGRCALDDALAPAPGGFSVLPAGSGLVEYSRMTPQARERLVDVVDTVAPRFDRVLLDTGAGISDVVLFTVSLAAHVLVVATPEPTSMTDAYATIKVLAMSQQRRRFRLVVNQAAQSGLGRAMRAQLQQVLDRYGAAAVGAPVHLDLLGEVPFDAAVRQSVQRRQLLLEMLPGSPAAKAIRQLAMRLHGAGEHSAA